jgi:hypothetical protein
MNHTVFFLAVIFSATCLYGQSQIVPPSAPVPDTSLRRFEAGLQVGDVHTGGAGNCYSVCPSSEALAGIRASLNLNQYLAIDSSFNITSNSPYDQGSASGVDNIRLGGHASEFLFGAKGTVRGKRWGLFGDAEPGLLSWSHAALDLSTATTPGGRPGYNFGRRNSFALNLGGGVEYSPRARMRVRMEVSDLLVDSNDTFTYFFSFYGTKEVSPVHLWLNELQVTGSASWAFGKPVAWTPPDIHQTPSHRFFDKTNFTVLTVSLLGQASDAITTQRFIKRGGTEGNPISKPFVSQGWPGQIGIGILDNGCNCPSCTRCIA